MHCHGEGAFGACPSSWAGGSESCLCRGKHSPCPGANPGNPGLHTLVTQVYTAVNAHDRHRLAGPSICPQQLPAPCPSDGCPLRLIFIRGPGGSQRDDGHAGVGKGRASRSWSGCHLLRARLHWADVPMPPLQALHPSPNLTPGGGSPSPGGPCSPPFPATLPAFAWETPRLVLSPRKTGSSGQGGQIKHGAGGRVGGTRINGSGG